MPAGAATSRAISRPCSPTRDFLRSRSMRTPLAWRRNSCSHSTPVARSVHQHRSLPMPIERGLRCMSGRCAATHRSSLVVISTTRSPNGDTSLGLESTEYSATFLMMASRHAWSNGRELLTGPRSFSRGAVTFAPHLLPEHGDDLRAFLIEERCAPCPAAWLQTRYSSLRRWWR